MRYTNRLKRVADALEKLAVAGMAVPLFRGEEPGTGFWGAIVMLVISIAMTREDA